MDLDFDFAFRLQVQEAINASLSLQPSSSSVPPPAPLRRTISASQGHNLDPEDQELKKFSQECHDRKLIEDEARRMREDLHRQVHDWKVAREIQRMPDYEWEEQGDNFEVPYSNEGSSSGYQLDGSELFRVYCKGLVIQVDDGARGVSVPMAGIGVAIADPRNVVVFELSKPLRGDGMTRKMVEMRALIDGLNAAIELGLTRILFYCDYFPIYQWVKGRWSPKTRKLATIVGQVTRLQEKFTYSCPIWVSRSDVRFAFEYARKAALSQLYRPDGSCNPEKNYVNCVICLEDTDVDKMFYIDGCKHCFCFSCMKQHVEVKLLHGLLPKCPQEGCNSELLIDNCKKFLTSKFVHIMEQRLKEASIPVTDKVYCPYPKCSALMSKYELFVYSTDAFNKDPRAETRKCIKCGGLFCISCKVPWHANMTCYDYRRRNPLVLVEDAKLKKLAASNLWRQCVKCNHMIELAAGCFHMTCRCGHEFCYTCGAEWKNKKATCSCPIWTEDNILYDQDDDFDEDEDSDYNDFDSDSDSDF